MSALQIRPIDRENWTRKFNAYNSSRKDGLFILEMYPGADGEEIMQIPDFGAFFHESENGDFRIVFFARKLTEFSMYVFSAKESGLSVNSSAGSIFPYRSNIMDAMRGASQIHLQKAVGVIKIAINLAKENIDKIHTQFTH